PFHPPACGFLEGVRGGVPKGIAGAADVTESLASAIRRHRASAKGHDAGGAPLNHHRTAWALCRRRPDLHARHAAGAMPTLRAHENSQGIITPSSRFSALQLPEPEGVRGMLSSRRAGP